MIDALLALPAHLRKRLESALLAGSLAPPYQPAAVRAEVGHVVEVEEVVDDETVFVTSANLTEAALDHNIEVGLPVRDRTLAASVATHFATLIDRSLLRLLPA